MLTIHIDKANAGGKTGVTLCEYEWKPPWKAILGHDIVFYDKEKDLVNCPKCIIEWNKQFEEIIVNTEQIKGDNDGTI